MSLSPDDVQAIGALLDEKLGRIQAVERRRRRFWLWFWIALFVISSVISWIVTQRFISQIQAQVAQANDEMRASKLAYQAELKHNAQLQAERKAAEKAVHYESDQSQASYEAGLISSLFRMQAQAAALKKDLSDKAEAAPTHGARTEQDAIADLDESAQDLKRTQELASSATGLLMKILLRNTDPVHNSTEDKLQGSEVEGAAGPMSGPRTPDPRPRAP